MNPVVGGTSLPPVSLQQPAAVAYTPSAADGASLGGALSTSRSSAVTRFDAAMATSPTQHVTAVAGASATSLATPSTAAPISGMTQVSMAQAVPSRAAPAQAANGVAAVSNVSNVSAVQAPPDVTGVQRIQPVEHTDGARGTYNDVNGLPRLPDGAASGDTSAAAAAADPADLSQATDPAASMGDRILSSLRSVSNGAAHTWSAIGQLAQQASGSMSVQQMLSFQIGAMQASVQFDYVGKIISRATQNLDQLVKTQ